MHFLAEYVPVVLCSEAVLALWFQTLQWGKLQRHLTLYPEEWLKLILEEFSNNYVAYLGNPVA